MHPSTQPSLAAETRTLAWTPAGYTVFRVVLGLYLLVHFVQLLPYAGELFSSQGMLPEAGLSPIAFLFPNLLSVADSPGFVIAFLLATITCSALFTLGIAHRVAALLLWYAWACLLGRNVLILNPSIPYVGWLLLAHLFVPPTRRKNDSEPWHMPPAVYVSAWALLALGYTYSGLTKLDSPSWLNGTAIARVLDNPLARPTPLRDLILSLPAAALAAMTYAALALELAFAPLALVRRLRPWIWAAMLIMHLGLLLLIDFADLTTGMLLIHALTFNPAWLTRRKPSTPDERPMIQTMPEMIYYDGDCGLCHRWVKFVMPRDPDGSKFAFSPINSGTFNQRIPAEQREGLPDSILVQRADGTLLAKSSAVFHILRQIGGGWKLLASTLAIIPRPVRDWGYDRVAAIRHRLFKKPTEACPMMPPELRGRFHF